MKKFLLFSGDWYYPRGGMKDFDGEFDSMHECVAEFNRLKDKCVARYVNPKDYWGQVYSTTSKRIVKKLGRK